MAKFPEAITNLVDRIATLPGVGKKTAERYAFAILGWNEDARKELAEQCNTLSTKISTCETCGCYTEPNRCSACTDATRDPQTLLVVAHPKDIYALSALHTFKGHFHVLGGLLSPLDGIDPEHINLKGLISRVHDQNVSELILALDATIEGDATSLFIKETLTNTGVNVTRFAHGLPIGSSLEYVDEHTLSQAFSARNHF